MQFENEASRSNVHKDTLDNNDNSNFNLNLKHEICLKTSLLTSKVLVSSSAQIEEGVLKLNGKAVCNISQLIYALELEQKNRESTNNTTSSISTNEAIWSFFLNAKNLSDNTAVVKLEFIEFESLLLQEFSKLRMPNSLNKIHSIHSQLIDRYEMYCNGKIHLEHFGFRDDIVTHFVKESGKSGFNQVSELLKVDQLGMQIKIVEKSMRLCANFKEIISKTPSAMRSIFDVYSRSIFEAMAEIYDNKTQSRLEMSVKTIQTMIDDYPLGMGLTRSNTIENKALTSFFIDSLIPLRLSEALCEYRTSSYLLEDLRLKLTNRPLALYLERVDQILAQLPNEAGEYQPFSKAIRQIRQVGNALGYMSLM